MKNYMMFKDRLALAVSKKEKKTNASISNADLARVAKVSRTSVSLWM